MYFYAGESGYESISGVVKQYSMTEIEPVLIRPFSTFKAGDYKITSLKATHDFKSSPMIFLIEKDNKTIFYSNDTGDYPMDTWDYLQHNPVVCKLISFDCTEANSEVNYEGHMNLRRCIATRERLLEIGMADENTIFVLNHFSHNGKDVIYEEFKEIAEKQGFLVSYDGMEIEI